MSDLERGTPFSPEQEERVASIIDERVAPLDAKLDHILAQLRRLNGEG